MRGFFTLFLVLIFFAALTHISSSYLDSRSESQEVELDALRLERDYYRSADVRNAMVATIRKSAEQNNSELVIADLIRLQATLNEHYEGEAHIEFRCGSSHLHFPIHAPGVCYDARTRTFTPEMICAKFLAIDQQNKRIGIPLKMGGTCTSDKVPIPSFYAIIKSGNSTRSIILPTGWWEEIG